MKKYTVVFEAVTAYYFEVEAPDETAAHALAFKKMAHDDTIAHEWRDNADMVEVWETNHN